MFCEPAYLLVLEHLGKTPFNYLEIGVFNGDGIAGIAQRHPDRIVFGIDPFIEDGATTAHTGVAEAEDLPKQRENTNKNIAGLSNAVLFEVTSQEFAKMLTSEMIQYMNIGWVLIDGSHHYSDVATDINLALRVIGDKPGVIIFDDVNLPGVNQAYQEFLARTDIVKSPAQDIYSIHPGRILFHTINQQ